MRRCACAPGCKQVVDPGTLEDAADLAQFLASTDPADCLCGDCEDHWLDSQECDRSTYGGPAATTALADFARRRSAELLHGGRP